MKRILILVAVSMFLCATAGAIQGVGVKPAKNPKPAPKSGPRSPKPGAERPKAPTQSKTKATEVVKLTAHDMQVIFQELLTPQKQQEIASNPEERKTFVTDIKKLFVLAQEADQKNYAERSDLKAQISFQIDSAINDAYKRKHPKAKIPNKEIDAYNASHPKAFDEFLQGTTRLAEEAKGPRRNELKKQFGEFMVIAERGRKEGLDREERGRIQILVVRSQALAGAYLSELRKDAEKLVSAVEINRYYQDHPDDFAEIRVRHILISTQIDEEPADEDIARESKDRKDNKPVVKQQALTKEEARKKSQLLLDRVRKGEDFAKLAEQNSDDPGSTANGGEYGFFGRGKMVTEFENAAFALKPGEVSDLVETQFGFHIIKVEERRTAPSPVADRNVRQQIIDKLTQGKLETLIAEIVEKSPVVVPEDFNTTPKTGANKQ